MTLSNADALRAYARAINTLDSSHLVPLLADDFRYASQWVMAEIGSKVEFVTYIESKLRAIAESGTLYLAEMAELEHELPGPCVVLASDEPDQLIATVLAEVRGERISRLDMCAVPAPQSAIRSGEYPGLSFEATRAATELQLRRERERVDAEDAPLAVRCFTLDIPEMVERARGCAGRVASALGLDGYELTETTGGPVDREALDEWFRLGFGGAFPALSVSKGEVIVWRADQPMDADAIIARCRALGLVPG